jgi:hypothetical protein
MDQERGSSHRSRFLVEAGQVGILEARVDGAVPVERIIADRGDRRAEGVQAPPGGCAARMELACIPGLEAP